MSFFNTTSEVGQMLIDFEAKAKKQEDIVYDVYRSLGKPLSPSEVLFILTGSKTISSNTPITSIRRAITNLTGEMKLRKTAFKKIGAWGKPEFLWELNLSS